MKKMLLLAGVASVFAFNANAMEMKPYVGLDYNYSDAAIAHHDRDWGYFEKFNNRVPNIVPRHYLSPLYIFIYYISFV